MSSACAPKPLLRINTKPAAPAATSPNPAAQKAWTRGVEATRLKQYAKAAEAFQHAVRIAPAVGLYWLNLARARRQLKQYDAAIEAARKAFELDRSDSVACHMLVEVLRMNNRHADALEALQLLDPSVPQDATHHFLVGSLQQAKGDHQAAAIAFLKVLALKPADIPAYTQLGNSLASLSRHGDAAECFRTITMIKPDDVGAAIYAAHYASWACDWTAFAEDHERMVKALALQEGRTDTPPFSPFCLLSMNDDAGLHLRAARIESARIAKAVRNSTSSAAQVTMKRHTRANYPQVLERKARGERTRVGFISADFRLHATSMLLVQTLERLDRSRFEVVLYSHGKDDKSAMRDRLLAAADLFVDCQELNTEEHAQRIRDDGIALLVDQSGYTAQTRLGVLALRPAPVQALWLGYPSTTGAEFIDYMVGDPILTPMEHQEDFSECIAQLPVTYSPTDEKREHPEPLTREECGLPEDAFVYACFNQSYKITEEVFSRWCRILQRTPGSVLWLLVPQVEIQSRLRRAAAQRGVDADRLVFAPFVAPSRHLARLPQADVFLDTFPYGAHTTCSDALWMGLPVITQVGRSFSARVAASLLHAVGLPELAVADAEEYERLAVMVAQDREALADIRAHLAGKRTELPLFDNQRFAREVGELFGRMVGRWEQGLPPEALPAQG